MGNRHHNYEWGNDIEQNDMDVRIDGNEVHAPEKQIPAEKLDILQTTLKDMGEESGCVMLGELMVTHLTPAQAGCCDDIFFTPFGVNTNIQISGNEVTALCLHPEKLRSYLKAKVTMEIQMMIELLQDELEKLS